MTTDSQTTKKPPDRVSALLLTVTDTDLQWTTRKPNSMKILTHSSMTTSKTCLKKYWHEYVLGVRRDRKSQPLRMGSAYHDALERDDITNDGESAIYKNYRTTPDWADDVDWIMEQEKILVLFAAHQELYADDQFEIIATEQQFNLPLINPSTGASSRTYRLAGKIDRVVKLPDGRIAIQEYKTCSEDLSPDSDYWRRLRMDQQISMYMLAARKMGHDVDTVIYDVTRKPTIKPRLEPVRDEQGYKIVIDDETGERLIKKNGEPYQSVPKGRAATIQSVIEDVSQYRVRLTEDIITQPGKYFARMEIPRLDSDLREFEHELWDIAKTLGECDKYHRWYRNTSACLHPYKCPYFDICTNNIDLSDNVPEGFTITPLHPELQKEKQ